MPQLFTLDPPLTKEDPRVFHLGPPGVAPAMDVMVRFLSCAHIAAHFSHSQRINVACPPKGEGTGGSHHGRKTAICFRQSGITLHVSPRLHHFLTLNFCMYGISASLSATLFASGSPINAWQQQQ